ncbi:copper resistance protein [Streptomyces bungoensis]|uniref:Copper resistance protein n=1 Tax=Streptomyces bungoensis TaxID=285568 RepID=A0A117RBX0_9ACTN|nr:DUF305 domain-containing protein [Streptomyces bungoensis]KUN82213.1 copper resistance protein [Streptomyces bungoensis]
MASRRSLVRRAVALTTAATAAVVLAACGSSDSSSSSSSPAPGHSGHDMGAMHPSGTASEGSHDPQDASFAQGMIPHHRQAVAMADLAASRAKSPQVKDLAAKIKKAQDPEIDTMSGWLKAWGEKVPGDSESGMGSMPGMDHSASSMPGMMSDQDMGRLKGLSGDAFDKAFLQMMISHHQGAIAMAKTEQAKGAYGPAKLMAKSIVTSQSAEITEMNKMLGRQ